MHFSVGYTAQAEFHAVNARKIMTSAVHSANSEQARAKNQELLINIHYIHGRALALQKKYNSWLFLIYLLLFSIFDPSSMTL